jgi:hypothetical protein
MQIAHFLQPLLTQANHLRLPGQSTSANDPLRPSHDPLSSSHRSLQITVTDSYPVLNSDLSLWMILIHMIEESMKILYRSVLSDSALDQ